MVKIGKLPLKIKAELTYAVVSPDDFGEEWKFLVQFTSVIPSPFRK